MKKISIIFFIIMILSILLISFNAKVIVTPQFDAIDVHNTQILELFEPDDKDATVMFATLMNNKAVERTDYVVTDIYAWQDKYIDTIFFYESDNVSWNDAVHLNLENNVFSFKLSKPMENDEKLAVIFDDGMSVWIEYLTQDDFYMNMYWIYDVYTPDSIDVKVIAYNDNYNQYGVPMRYAYVLTEQHVVSYMPNSEKYILSFKLSGQLGDTVIDNYNGTITILMPVDADISELSPSVVHSHKAQILPDVSVKQDFTNDIIYTVVAEDNSKTTYTVHVLKESPSYIAPIYSPFYYPCYNYCKYKNHYHLPYYYLNYPQYPLYFPPNYWYWHP